VHAPTNEDWVAGGGTGFSMPHLPDEYRVVVRVCPYFPQPHYKTQGTENVRSAEGEMEAQGEGMSRSETALKVHQSIMRYLTADKE